MEQKTEKLTTVAVKPLREMHDTVFAKYDILSKELEIMVNLMSLSYPEKLQQAVVTTYDDQMSLLFIREMTRKYNENKRVAEKKT